MKPFFEIKGRKIGYDYDPLVIAEIGINHGWSLEVAFAMVDAAKRAWAEIIKHQTHVVTDEMSQSAKNIIPGNADISIYDIMHQCALSESDEYSLMEYVLSNGMIFLSTPFSRAAADRLERFWVPAYKIGSWECNNYPLIDYIASLKKPIILSTGMNTITSIQKAVDIFRKHDVPYALLHCTNVYPTPHKLVRLGAIRELQDKFPDAVIGLSDHTIDNYACLGATALGASILERHFTDTMERIWPDIVCSMDEKSLKELIMWSKILKQERWGAKDITPEEEPTMRFAFATVVAIRDIQLWEMLSRENIWVKRPWTGGISAEHFESIIGKKINKKILQDSHLSFSDIIL